MEYKDVLYDYLKSLNLNSTYKKFVEIAVNCIIDYIDYTFDGNFEEFVKYYDKETPDFIGEDCADYLIDFGYYDDYIRYMYFYDYAELILTFDEFKDEWRSEFKEDFSFLVSGILKDCFGLKNK